MAPTMISANGVVKKANLVSRHSSSAFVEQHYDVIREIGGGNFGKVSLVRERATGQTRVCKIVSTHGMKNFMLELSRREVELLVTLDHPHVVRLYEYAEDTSRNQIVLITENVPGGDIAKLLLRQGALKEAFVARVIRQLLSAVGHLHTEGVMHRDIKPDNVMVTEVRPNADPHCKLIDFGLAAYVDTQLRECAGSAGYLAPEVARCTKMGQAHFTTKADIWAVGITAMHMLTGIAPFRAATDSSDRVLDRIKAYQTFDDLSQELQELRANGVSEEAYEFLRWLLSKHPANRPTAQEAFEHPWLEQHALHPVSLTGEMLRGLQSFSAALPSERCCALILAARTEVPEHKHAGAAFLGADFDLDGQLTREDLAQVCARSQGWWGPGVDADEVLEAGDLKRSGGLGYTEFLAACSYAAHQKYPESLLEAAFDALDDDRDGKISVQDLRRLLSERDFPALAELPQGRPFGLEEWRRCIRRCSRSTSFTVSESSSSGKLDYESLGIFGQLMFCQTRLLGDDTHEEDYSVSPMHSRYNSVWFR